MLPCCNHAAKRQPTNCPHCSTPFLLPGALATHMKTCASIAKEQGIVFISYVIKIIIIYPRSSHFHSTYTGDRPQATGQQAIPSASEEAFPCARCGTVFCPFDAPLKHSGECLLDSGKRVYPCGQCESTFLTERTLRNHRLEKLCTSKLLFFLKKYPEKD